MSNRALWITAVVIAIVLLLVVNVSAQSSMQKIYGYVRVDGNLTNGVTVRLAGEGISGQLTADTANDTSGTIGYYEFAIENGSGKGFTVSASYNNRSGSYSFLMPATGDKHADLSLTATATPTPSPTPTPTPTPGPSGDIGGMVTRNDSSSFIPVAAHNSQATPTAKPSWAPSASPTATPVPTPAPAGIFSNIYLWLAIAAIAVIAIIAIAAAILWYLRK